LKILYFRNAFDVHNYNNSYSHDNGGYENNSYSGGNDSGGGGVGFASTEIR
jgi:hypothetical protein